MQLALADFMIQPPSQLIFGSLDTYGLEAGFGALTLQSGEALAEIIR